MQFICPICKVQTSSARRRDIYTEINLHITALHLDSLALSFYRPASLGLTPKYQMVVVAYAVHKSNL
jgi:hypothetical protein